MYYKDKQSGLIVSAEEMLDMTDSNDELDSFYLLSDIEIAELQATNMPPRD